MERLRTWSYQQIKSVPKEFTRTLASSIRWNSRLIVITGARGVGKTTLMLQHIEKNIPLNEEVLYVAADDIFFTNNTLIDLADDFVKRGGKYLFVDEVHKYANWSTEIKSIYDNFKELQIVLSGSSTLEIKKGEADLSRRAIFYHLIGLSFREYIHFQYELELPSFSLNDIITNSKEISWEISNKIKPIKMFKEYLNFGYYPFFKEDKETYHKRIAQILSLILEVDIPSSFSIDYSAVAQIRKLIGLIAPMVPFKPNITKLSQQIGLSRETFIRYLQYLNKTDVLNLLYSQTKGVSSLNKPEKVYLHNPNLAFAIADHNINVGNLRETFFFNQVGTLHSITYPSLGDFFVDDKYTFEVGGKSKTMKQIEGIKNSYIASDEIEISVGEKIPLWLFGFLY